MALFRRPGPGRGGARGGPRPGGVTLFWAWWATVRDDVAAAVAAGQAEAHLEALAERVAAVHPGLDVEVAPGSPSRHALVVSSGGNPDLRAVAERWFRGAPPPDEVWEYQPARRPDPGGLSASLSLAGRTLPLAGTTVAARVDDQRCRLDVVVHHPSFPDLPDEARLQIAYLVLDWALGEDDVERWVGTVSTAGERPLDPVPATALGSVVHDLRERWGRETWVMLEGTGPKGRPVLAMARHPMHRVDFPLFDEHVVVRLPFSDRTDEGLPGERSLADLRSFEDHVLERLGGSAVLVAHESSGGQRLLHLYGDAEHSVRPQLEPIAAAWADGRAKVEAELDPAWESTAHLRP